MIGSVFDSVSKDRSPTKLRIDGLERGEGTNRDLLYYSVSLHQDEAWKPLCADQAPAIALPGAWDLSSGAAGQAGWIDVEGFFFACAGSSVAKCYELGFKPWKIVRGDDGGISSLHEACVRALRADYQGTGESHTRSGVEMVLATGIDDALADEYQLEALWGTEGARCRVLPRQQAESEALMALDRCLNQDFDDDKTLIDSFFRPEQPDLFADVNSLTQERKDKNYRERLPRTLRDGVWLVGPASYQDLEPVVGRVMATGGTWVDYRMETLNPGDSAHGHEYLALGGFERGPHRLGGLRAEGRAIWVGSETRRVYFRQHFKTPPVVLASLRGEGADVPVTVRVFDVTRRSYRIRLGLRHVGYAPVPREL